MKKTILFSLCALAALATFSCTKSEISGDADGLRVPANISASASATRATISGLQTSWEIGDQISVFSETGTAEGAFTSEDEGTNATFTGSKGVGDVLKYAVYPHKDGAACTGGGVISTTIPGEQDGTINSAVAVAVESAGAWNFHNAASVIKITIPALETAINFVSFVADNAATIAGDVTIDTADNTAVASTDPEAVKYSCVNVYRDGAVLSGDLYLTVIPGDYSGRVVFGKKDGSRRYAATVKVSSRTFSVNRIKDFGTASGLSWVSGAVPGVFSLNNSGKKALMSQGYIRYDVVNDTWSIADTFTRLTSWTPTEIIELFRWDNADTPTSTTTHASAYSEAGDWAKKLEAGWSTGTWQEYEFCFKNTADNTTKSREDYGLVQKCAGLVKVADNEYYAILYPDGWVGEFANYTASTQIPGVTMTISELKTLEDKGCAIFGLGNSLNKSGVWTVATPPQLNIWTTVWSTNKAAYAFRFVYTSGNWTRLVRGLEHTYGYCARPYYELD